MFLTSCRNWIIIFLHISISLNEVAGKLKKTPSFNPNNLSIGFARRFCSYFMVRKQEKSHLLASPIIDSHFEPPANFHGYKIGNLFSRKGIVMFLIISSYTSIIVSIMTLPSVLKVIDSDESLSNDKNMFSSVTDIISVATLFTMGGKFVFGPITDSIGGDATLLSSMFATSILLAIAAAARTVPAFAIVWTAISFIYASGWGAVSSIIRVRIIASLALTYLLTHSLSIYGT